MSNLYFPQGFGYSKVNTQLFTVIVYVCAFIGLLIFGFAADRTNKRGLTLAAANGTTVLGYALLLGLTSPKGRFAATCITAFGAYAAIVLQISWLTMSVVGYTHRYATSPFHILNQLSTRTDAKIKKIEGLLLHSPTSFRRCLPSVATKPIRIPPIVSPRVFPNILCHKAFPSTNVRSSTPVF